MNKLILFILAVLLIAGAGYFIFTSQGTKPQQSETTTQQIPEVANQQTSNYKDYSSEEYQKALRDQKIVLLYFIANWCPICREQEPINIQVMKELEQDSQILAFRVHILDSETTKETEELADGFGVTYQHTYVIIKPGGVVSSTYTGPLTNEEIKNRLQKAKTGG